MNPCFKISNLTLASRIAFPIARFIMFELGGTLKLLYQGLSRILADILMLNILELVLSARIHSSRIFYALNRCLNSNHHMVLLRHISLILPPEFLYSFGFFTNLCPGVWLKVRLAFSQFFVN
jgi:hypothetical protein